MISSRPIAVAAAFLAALVLPSGAVAHPAYVDAQAVAPFDPQCATPQNPCATIEEAIGWVEPGLQVIVDDSRLHTTRASPSGTTGCS